MRGHPAFYSGGAALQNIIPQGFLNAEMTCATQSGVNQRTGVLTGKGFPQWSFYCPYTRTASHSVVTDRTQLVSPK